MKFKTQNSQLGTVTLVSLCFVSIMGITLAGYIAVCSRAMNLSNRSFQCELSKLLAEAGLDEALRAFNKNDWSGWASNPTDVTGGTTAWTLDTTNKRATRTITFVAEKIGFTNPRSRQYLGDVTVGDIGCQRELIEAIGFAPSPLP